MYVIKKLVLFGFLFSQLIERYDGFVRSSPRWELEILARCCLERATMAAKKIQYE